MKDGSVIARVISEIRGEMTDKEFADALGGFTTGKFHPSFNTIQKYRTGQREPGYQELQWILSYGKQFKRISKELEQELADFFHLSNLVQSWDTDSLKDVRTRVLISGLDQLIDKIDNKEIKDFYNPRRDLLVDSLIESKTDRENLLETFNYFKDKIDTLVNIPILGQVPAGLPINAMENNEGYMTLPRTMLKGDDYFFLKVHGESMKDVEISDGDLVLVRKEETADDGQTVVARLNGQDVTVKKFYHAGDKVMLIPANKDFEPISTTDVEIIGVVERVMKNWEA